MFPESPGGQLCYNLIQSIEAKDLQISTERVWNKPWPEIRVHYRNLAKVHFRAVRYDWQKLLASHRDREKLVVIEFLHACYAKDWRYRIMDRRAPGQGGRDDHAT